MKRTFYKEEILETRSEFEETPLKDMLRELLRLKDADKKLHKLVNE